MFKNATIYRIVQDFRPAAEDEENLGNHAFQACGLTQAASHGWVPPREAHGDLLEIVGGQCLMKLMSEVRRVPAEVVQEHVEAAAAKIEETTGRKPGKKERRELKEWALQELLPRAFPAKLSTLVWLDPKAQTLVINTASQARADLVATHLVGSLVGLVLAPLQTQTSPAAAMSEWLCSHEPPECFSVGRECVLEAADESKAGVRYNRHALDISEVTNHVMQGKVPKALALTWNNRVSFQLTDSLHLASLEFIDVELDANDVDLFDSSFAICTGSLQGLIPDIVAALGGAPQPQDNP